MYTINLLLGGFWVERTILGVKKLGAETGENRMSRAWNRNTQKTMAIRIQMVLLVLFGWKSSTLAVKCLSTCVRVRVGGLVNTTVWVD